MMTGAKAIDINHKEKGIEQTHTWGNTTKKGNLESCMTKTQELIQDVINNLFSTTEMLSKMKNSIMVTDLNELDSKTSRSVLELKYKFLEM